MARMRSAQIPDFIDELLEAGADTWAIAPGKYVLGDADAEEDVRQRIYQICDRYGDRDHLRDEMAEYLTSIGRLYVLP